jgi:hypothetical protein
MDSFRITDIGAVGDEAANEGVHPETATWGGSELSRRLDDSVDAGAAAGPAPGHPAAASGGRNRHHRPSIDGQREAGCRWHDDEVVGGRARSVFDDQNAVLEAQRRFAPAAAAIGEGDRGGASVDDLGAAWCAAGQKLKLDRGPLEGEADSAFLG